VARCGKKFGEDTLKEYGIGPGIFKLCKTG
jgi:hypothetical protein